MVRESDPAGVLTLGASVYGQDGALLGQVTAIHNRHFHVTPPQAAASWLSSECICSTGAGEGTPGTDSAELSDYQMDCPDGADVHESPDVGGEH